MRSLLILLASLLFLSACSDEGSGSLKNDETEQESGE